jgi:hypothetical protein
LSHEGLGRILDERGAALRKAVVFIADSDAKSCSDESSAASS